MDRIFSRDGRLVVLNIRKSVSDHRQSQPLVQQRRILVILCILCIHVQKLGREDLVFHPRMIRLVVGGRGGTCLKHSCVTVYDPPGTVGARPATNH